MSLQITQEQADAALDLLVERAHAPAFFAKLAQYDIVPRNTAEEEQLLALAAQLREQAAAGGVKLAAEQPNAFLSYALDQLQPAQPRQLAAAAQQAVAQDPLLKTAAVVYGHLLAGAQPTPAAPAASASAAKE